MTISVIIKLPLSLGAVVPIHSELVPFMIGKLLWCENITQMVNDISSIDDSVVVQREYGL